MNRIAPVGTAAAGLDRLFLISVAVTMLLAHAVDAQQTQLTEEQLEAAAIEVPRLVDLLELKAGVTIADVGAGFGAWTMEFARVTGPTGRVYATDIGDAQLESLRDLVQREGLTNVIVVEGAVNTTNLPALCCDAILVRDAYHHFSEPEGMVQSLAASLKPGGRLAIIDFPPRPNSSVPEGVPANRGGHGVPSEIVQREVIATALTHVTTIQDWSKRNPSSLFLTLFQKR